MVEIIQNFQMKCVDCQSPAEQVYHLFATGSDPVVFVTDNGRYAGALEKSAFLRTDPKLVAANGWQEQIDFGYPAIQKNGNDKNVCKLQAISLLNKNRALQRIPVLTPDNRIEYGIQRTMSDRNTVENQFYSQYVLLLQAGYSIGDYLRLHNIHSVSIYGTDELAVLLYNDLVSFPGIQVKWIIDHRQVRIGETCSILWKDITQEVLDSAQLIIVTCIHSYNELFYHIKRRGFRQVVSIQDIATQLFRYAFETKPLIDKLLDLQSRGVSVYYAHFPTILEVQNPSPREQQIFSQQVSSIAIRKDLEKYQDIVLQGVRPWYTKEDIPKLYLTPIPVVYKNGVVVNADLCHSHYNIVNGHRVTPDNYSENQRHKVWFFGKSWTFGLCVKDSHTIESYFQKLLNHSSQAEYQAINCGSNGISLNQTLDKINSESISEGDVLILIFNDREFEKQVQINGLPYFDLTSYVCRPHNNGELYIDTVHVNPKGNEIMAQALYQSIFEKVPGVSSGCKEASPTFNYYGVREKSIAMRSIPVDNSLETNPQLLDFLEQIKKQRVNVGGKIGSIVMNCNPFTNGHRYLIETASRQVDHLYIFVVEEDKSVFPFRDRMDLVKKGAADLPNVTVLPSGKFIISSLTFPGYFLKGEKNDATVDTTQDLTLFAQKIAPTLGITVRFAGNEPSDNITRQYNEQMAKLLPRYGIQFVEIPRKEAAGRPISASTVRALLKEQQFEALKEIVPPTTFDYLLENHTKLHDTVHKS